ncbi:hypothetical protein GCM10011360_16150 [Primorskyibacter flagellatus]|uniref:Hedgehog/Intein (Hint) domain-containing protein n=1 Tax=Primorskyibacter flagellatus TaxID=1387277 RepID=A0A917EDT7_9RHOB|nr:Hint domain-containing protein [Primorskyibacter flagellatus]GGE28767.1 hypothetical protein GCM10011360_16150 [Primorskyibacter flagellatus]
MARTVDWDNSTTVTTGDASYDPVTGVYTLTPDQQWQAGLVSSTSAYSINYDFSFVYEAYYGANDAGADGITWMFHNDPDGNVITPSTGGEYFGTGHVENAWVLEYDTYQNGTEAAYDHIQLRAQSDAGGTFSSSYMSTPEIAFPSTMNIEDGAWHLNEITWTAATKTLTVAFDGVTLGSAVFDPGDANGDGFSEDDLTTVLGGDRVFFAVGAATGGASNEQAIRTMQMEGTICFTRGTRILTPEGDVPVHRLKVGDLVTTLEGAARPIRWIGCTEVEARGRLAPVRFAPGIVGNRRPLVVSPQHRIYVAGWQAQLFLGLDHCLVPAHGFVNGRSVRRVDDGRRVQYWHVMLDTHEVILAEGAPTETLLPGPVALSTLAPPHRKEILTLFPDLARGTFASAAPCVPANLAHAFAPPARRAWAS